MTTARERFGLLTGAVIAILVVGLLGVWVTRPAEDPGPIARAGLPATDSGYQPDEDANEEREEQGRGRRTTRRGLGGGAARRSRRPGREARLPPGRRGPDHDGLGRRDPDRHDGRRLGARHRGRPPRAVRLPPDDPLRHREAVPGELPHAVHRARRQRGQRRHLERGPTRCAPARAPASSTRSSRSSRTRATSTPCS